MTSAMRCLLGGKALEEARRGQEACTRAGFRGETACMCADRKIDITQLLADVPDLAQLPGVCRDGVFAGAPFEVAWDGTWHTTHRGDAFGLRLHDVPRETDRLDTAQGTLTLRRPLATNSSSSGTVLGVALSLSLRLAGNRRASRPRCFAPT